MREMNLKIDTEKCIHCGLCVKDCSVKVLEFDENKIPRVAQGCEKSCMACQHCLAICPTGALSVFGLNPEDSAPASTVNPEELLSHIKNRRSIRQLKKENVSPEIMSKLKEMLDFVPTGCNDHRLHFTFVEDYKVMDEYREYVSNKLINLFKKIPSVFLQKFARNKDRILGGEDIIFRDAPHLLIVSSPVNAPCKDVDPIIALSYFELYAQSLGVGTIWCGLAQFCLNTFPELIKKFKIPKDYKPVYVMLFGPSNIKYARAIQPLPYDKTVLK